MIIDNTNENTPVLPFTVFYDVETDKSDGYIDLNDNLFATVDNDMAKYVTSGTINLYMAHKEQGNAENTRDIMSKKAHCHSPIGQISFVAFNENTIEEDSKSLESLAYEHITGSENRPLECIDGQSLMSLRRADKDVDKTMFIIELSSFHCSKGVTEDVFEHIFAHLPDIFRLALNMDPHLFVTTIPLKQKDFQFDEDYKAAYDMQKNFLLRMNFLPTEKENTYVMNVSMHEPFKDIFGPTDIRFYLN